MRVPSNRWLAITALAAASGVAFAAHSVSAQVTPPKEHKKVLRPDLIVSDMTFHLVKAETAPDGSVCHHFDLRVTFSNSGEAGTGGPVPVALERQSAGGRFEWVASAGGAVLGPGASWVRDFRQNTCDRPGGTFKAIADSENLIVESDETNNTKVATFRPPLVRKR